jgi:methoxymalonate biosynthesis protein
MTTAMPLVKCVVWDLDETVWQGTLLEGDEPVLRPGVRETIVELDRRGVLNSVASRNDHDQAWERLVRLGLDEYLVAPQIGWGRKPEALRRIAETLQFATTTLAFIDDQPQERAEVAQALPDVRRYRPEDVATLVDRPEFTPPVVTPDAAARRRRYQQGQARDRARQEFDGPDEAFARSLRVRMRLTRATPADIARLAELTVRTSQMNATGVYYDHDTLTGLTADPAHEVLAVTMDDRFGEHGAVGIVLLGLGDRRWHLKLLATSCRVVSYGAGSVVLSWLMDRAARAGVDLVADFRETDRNRIMQVAYRFAGFDEAPAAVTAGLPAAGDGVVRLHVAPSRQRPPATIRVTGVRPGSSGGDTADEVEWTA